MNDANSKIKQQIVEKIKSSTNILLTVSRNPSVDDLSAALGLATILNKLDKHATAIFSGAIPPAITFLDPTKVFENNVDSLRDFIIALDKEKADHLRYKVEGDLVKIFITPYRTTISNEDLEFSHGDFNVDLVVALGVSTKEELDTAIEAHGNILQNVTVITLSAGTQTSQLGTIDWHEDTASSLSEMVAGIGESIKSDKPLLDQQIATALLTGIVSATDRFSNARTTAKVMSVAAQLMAAGADQQLIAARLQEAHEINSLKYNPIISKNGQPIVTSESPKTESKPADGSLSIQHEKPDLKPVSNIASVNIEKPIEPEINPVKSEVVTPKIEAIAETPISTLPPQIEDKPVDVMGAMPTSTAEPALGGTLSATSEQAAEDARRDLEDQQNKVILKHSYVSDENAPSINSIGKDNGEGESVDIFANAPMAGGEAPKIDENTMGQQAMTITPPSENVDVQPVVTAPIIDLPMPPPLPDFSTLPPPGSETAMNMGSVQSTPSEASTLPPIGTESSIGFDMPQQPASPELSTLPPQSTVSDPSQFKIPGQN